MQEKRRYNNNGALIAFGNNSISLLAGMAIFATVFALTTGDALKEISVSGPANTGLTFISLPNLFKHMQVVSLSRIYLHFYFSLP